MKILSTNTQLLIDNNYGYRAEEYNSIGPRQLEDVINFEIGELHNEDILDFVNNYINNGKQLKTSNDVIKYLYSLTQADQLYCIWLTTAENAKKIYYIDDNTTYIDKYCLDQFILIISDLGPDGALFVSEKYPIPN